MLYIFFFLIYFNSVEIAFRFYEYKEIFFPPVPLIVAWSAETRLTLCISILQIRLEKSCSRSFLFPVILVLQLHYQILLVAWILPCSFSNEIPTWIFIVEIASAEAITFNNRLGSVFRKEESGWLARRPVEQKYKREKFTGTTCPEIHSIINEALLQIDLGNHMKLHVHERGLPIAFFLCFFFSFPDSHLSMNPVWFCLVLKISSN